MPAVIHRTVCLSNESSKMLRFWHRARMEQEHDTPGMTTPLLTFSRQKGENSASRLCWIQVTLVEALSGFERHLCNSNTAIYTTSSLFNACRHTALSSVPLFLSGCGVDCTVGLPLDPSSDGRSTMQQLIELQYTIHCICMQHCASPPFHICLRSKVYVWVCACVCVCMCVIDNTLFVQLDVNFEFEVQC